MLLTDRQIKIIAYLLGKKEWSTSDQVSFNLKINKKTIQNDIKQISELLGSECLITSNNSKGYKIVEISDNLCCTLYRDLESIGGSDHLSLRPSHFIMYLLFSNDYVSMQKLSEVFYISKTAVSIDIYTVKRWINRYEGITLEISGSKGIKIHASEERRRQYCSKFVTTKSVYSIPIDKHLINNYNFILINVDNVFKKILFKCNFILSGDEYKKICRFVSISKFRTDNGFLRGDVIKISSHILIIECLLHELYINFNYQFTKEEVSDFEALFEESCTIHGHEFAEVKIYDAINEFENKIREFLKINNDGKRIVDKDLLAFHVSKMNMRSDSNNVLINPSDEKICTSYPLEVHLVKMFFPKCFNLNNNKELSYIALFLCNNLSLKIIKKKILLVSNSNSSVLYQLKRRLIEGVGNIIEDVDFIPIYLYEYNKNVKFEYDILLSTDPELFFIEKECYYIDKVLSNDDLSMVSNIIYDYNENLKLKNRKIIENKYYKGEFLIRDDSVDLVAVINELNSDFVSSHVLKNDTLYIIKMMNGSDSVIIKYKINKSILVNQKKVNKIIYVSCDPMLNELYSFFDFLSNFLNL
jgi:lichenan operon transcriptional antiterminator